MLSNYIYRLICIFTQLWMLKVWSCMKLRWLLILRMIYISLLLTIYHLSTWHSFKKTPSSIGEFVIPDEEMWNIFEWDSRAWIWARQGGKRSKNWGSLTLTWYLFKIKLLWSKIFQVERIDPGGSCSVHMGREVESALVVWYPVQYSYRYSHQWRSPPDVMWFEFRDVMM